MTDAWRDEGYREPGPVETATPGREALQDAVWQPTDATPTWAPQQGEAWPEAAAPSHEQAQAGAAGAATGPSVTGEEATVTGATVTEADETPTAATPVVLVDEPEPVVLSGGGTVDTFAPTGRVPVATVTSTPASPRRSGPAHKVVPRPGSRVEAPRPSQLPYRIGALRRIRSSLVLLLLTALIGLGVAATLVAVVAGIAAAVSGAASS